MAHPVPFAARHGAAIATSLAPTSATVDAAGVAAWIAGVAPVGAALASDSRRIRRGDVFFAYPGESADGRQFIAAAVAQGASAVLYEARDFAWNAAWDRARDPAGDSDGALGRAPAGSVAHLAVADLKRHAGPIAHAFHHWPDSAMFTVGVTGTNGKTSCALWLGQAMARLGAPAAVIGTLGVGLLSARQGQVSGEFDVTGYTTPDAVLLAGALAGLRQAGAAALAIEVSSIGLHQGRAEGMHFDVALFTNLTRDHLDYHGDMGAYEAAKTMLFDWPGLQSAVLNLDDPAGPRLLEHVRGKPAGALPLIGYTLRDQAAQPDIDGVFVLRASGLRSRHAGTDFHLDCPLGSAVVKTHLVGLFNISNALGVLGALLAKGLALRPALDAIEALSAAPGRMQQVGGQDAPMVVIDYAHTPDALEKTLAALRQVADERGGQLWCVFGCGGDRDPGKRAQMGRIAQVAEHVLVTSDNPRSEDPHSIIEQIVAGMNQAHPTSVLQTIEDRAAAILSAIKHAAKADVILLAGKGHEPYQEIKGKKLPFSDADHAALALAARATMMRPA